MYHEVVFIESGPFTSTLRQVAGGSADAVLRDIENDLLKNPERGKVVKGLGGIRKARTGNPSRGKGKRGGFRCLYLYLKDRSHIHLLHLLDKDEQEDLTTAERTVLRAMVLEIRKEKGHHVEA